MSANRTEVMWSAIHRANESMDNNIYDDIHKHFEFQKQTLLADESLTEDEKIEVIKKISQTYDRAKIRNNSGTKRICENCNQECLATLFCEYCVRNYLKANFSNWTSGNDKIDDLIQKCQMETLEPEMIIEWIPPDNLQNFKYLAEGGFSKVYSGIWIDGHYTEWDSKKQQLKRFGSQGVVLKSLGNIENADQSWFEEVCNL
jgi:hypothetical protein